VRSAAVFPTVATTQSNVVTDEDSGKLKSPIFKTGDGVTKAGLMLGRDLRQDQSGATFVRDLRTTKASRQSSGRLV
jgi:hypothetical protein